MVLRWIFFLRSLCYTSTTITSFPPKKTEKLLCFAAASTLITEWDIKPIFKVPGCTVICTFFILSNVTFRCVKTSKPHAEFMRKFLFKQRDDTTLSLNHTNCLEQGTFRHTYGNLIHSIRLHLNPPPFIRTESVHGECSGNHVLITHWPFDLRAALIPPYSQTQLHGGCNRLQLCVRLLQDDASQWNLNCGACEYIVFVFRASPLSHSKLQGRAPLELRRRLSVTHPTSAATSVGLGYPDCKWAAVNEQNISAFGARLMPFNSRGSLVLYWRV